MSNPTNVFNKFPPTFWLTNTLELFERWAYYGMFAVISVYLTDPVSVGGLGFTQEQRGVMQAIATGILYLLPILGGAIADRFGYRKVLLGAFATLAAGYLAMGFTSLYSTVFLAFLFVALGGAFFKPVIVATVSKTTTKENDTLGFGIFYMIVNIGGFIGPFVASKLRDISWTYVFIMSALVILFNILLLYFYKEPKREKETEVVKLSATFRTLFVNTATVLKDFKFVQFLIIITGMWIMYMQLFFTLPVYITQWVDTSDLFGFSAILAAVFGTVENGKGIIRPEMILNIPAFTIIVFQVIMSNRLKNVRPVQSMMFGILVIALGFSIFSLSVWGKFLVMGIVILAFGEMASSPRIQEYISRIAPRDKVALYMGYSFLPVAGGNLLGGLLSGSLYGKLSDKYAFLKDYVATQGLGNMEHIENMDGAILFNQTVDKLGISPEELTQILYNQYHPGNIWLVFASIGATTAILLFFYNSFVLKK
ncbi:MAG: MFS transporter [Bacteroidales bacterium]|nr:MFS transporter [Bacteroidales bacterium]